MLSAMMRLASVITLAASAGAQFTVYEGDASTETQWRTAAAAVQGGNPVPLEDFESFFGTPFGGGPSDQVPALPALHIVSSTGVPGAYPGVYRDAQWAHSGENQLANFNGGLGQFADYDILPESGHAIYALGFWQCDPQGDQHLFAYDAANHLLGEIVGRINDGSGNSFAGFVSATPVARVFVEGALGDGWNHIDDLQVVSLPPCGGACPDIDCDGDVDLSDLASLLAHFGTPSGASRAEGDVTSDGDVDLEDLAVVLVHFGSQCG